MYMCIKHFFFIHAIIRGRGGEEPCGISRIHWSCSFTRCLVSVMALWPCWTPPTTLRPQLGGPTLLHSFVILGGTLSCASKTLPLGLTTWFAV